MRTAEKNPFYGKKHSIKSLEKNRKNNLYYSYVIYKEETKEVMYVDSLKLFCKERGLIYSNMRQRGYSKGYKVLDKKSVR